MPLEFFLNISNQFSMKAICLFFSTFGSDLYQALKTNMDIFIIFFISLSKQAREIQQQLGVDLQLVLPSFLLPWSLMGLECPWRNGRGKCQGPIADFIIQTQNLLHHFIGHRESNYIVVQFSTQWLYWGSKSVFMMGKNVLLFYLLLKIKKYRYYNAF